MATEALAISDIDTYYGDSHVLHGVSFSLQPGRLLGLLGRNGAGKTTCMATIMGFLKPRGGSISLYGEPVAGLAPDVIARKGICLVPQGRRMFRTLTVRENLMVAAQPQKKDNGAGWSIDRVFQTFPRLAVEADRTPPRLEEAHDRRHAGGLAGAVAAEQAKQPPRLQRERDAVQHVAVAVIGVDAGDVQRVSHRDRPLLCADRRPPPRASPRR